MHMFITKTLSTLAVTAAALLTAAPVEVLVLSEEFEPLTLELSEATTLEELGEQLHAYLGEGAAIAPIYLSKTSSPAAGQGLKSPRTAYNIEDNEGEGYSRDIAEGARDYYHNVSADEKKNISYIVKTLANKPEPALLFYKGSIVSAGDKIDHIHPLKFLHAIFTDEELKVGMRVVRKKSWVWGNFRSGISDSLRDEASVDNMTVEYLYDFAAAVDVDANLLIGAYNAQNWDSFIDGCVAHIPRKGDYRRYNM